MDADVFIDHVETFLTGTVTAPATNRVLATFDAPVRAVLCADGIRAALADIGIEVRIGLHTGEIERIGDDIAGLAVHVAARIAALAGADEILGSSTIPSLVVGSSVTFAELGTRTLKGIAEPWRIFQLVST